VLATKGGGTAAALRVARLNERLKCWPSSPRLHYSHMAAPMSMNNEQRGQQKMANLVQVLGPLT